MIFERPGYSVPKLFVVRPPCIASCARANAPIEESALHRVARECERCSEVLALEAGGSLGNAQAMAAHGRSEQITM
jgi:hypothetical protein